MPARRPATAAPARSRRLSTRACRLLDGRGRSGTELAERHRWHRRSSVRCSASTASACGMVVVVDGGVPGGDLTSQCVQAVGGGDDVVGLRTTFAMNVSSWVSRLRISSSRPASARAKVWLISCAAPVPTVETAPTPRRGFVRWSGYPPIPGRSPSRRAAVPAGPGHRRRRVRCYRPQAWSGRPSRCLAGS